MTNIGIFQEKQIFLSKKIEYEKKIFSIGIFINTFQAVSPSLT